MWKAYQLFPATVKWKKIWQSKQISYFSLYDRAWPCVLHLHLTSSDLPSSPHLLLPPSSLYPYVYISQKFSSHIISRSMPVFHLLYIFAGEEIKNANLIWWGCNVISMTADQCVLPRKQEAVMYVREEGWGVVWWGGGFARERGTEGGRERERRRIRKERRKREEVRDDHSHFITVLCPLCFPPPSLLFFFSSCCTCSLFLSPLLSVSEFLIGTFDHCVYWTSIPTLSTKHNRALSEDPNSRNKRLKCNISLGLQLIRASSKDTHKKERSVL